jgi:hypothetical protein
MAGDYLQRCRNRRRITYGIGRLKELDPQGGVTFLSPESWNQRRRRLEELGGPPKLWPSDPLMEERRPAWKKAAIEAVGLLNLRSERSS